MNDRTPLSEITAVILTGGSATRLRPLSLDKSKTMISLMGRPLLLHLLNLLKSYGFKNIILTSSGKKGDIRNYFHGGDNFGLNIIYYDSDKWFGTAGTIKEVILKMNNTISDPFFLIYGDSLLRVNLLKMFTFHKMKKSLCTILYHHPDFEKFLYDYHDGVFHNFGRRTNYGVIDIDFDNRITKVEEKPLISKISNGFLNPVANAAVYLLDKLIIDYIPDKMMFDFPKDLFPLLLEKRVSVFGFNIDNGYRIDLGTLANYFNTEFDILKGIINFDYYFQSYKNKIWIGNKSTVKSIDFIKKPVLIGDNCEIGDYTVLECSIIGNNVSVGNNSYLKNCIIFDNTMIGSGVKIVSSIIGEDCDIGDGYAALRNTVLGNHCKITKLII
jgi:mannose-1-phosphate guanylyltransferase/phosphomannomutase